VTTSPIEDAIFAALAKAPPGKSVSPEAVARAVDAENWRRVLPQVKATAVGLARQGRLAILRHGKSVDPEGFKGVWRMGGVPDSDPIG
jgi:hypothetical protein